MSGRAVTDAEEACVVLRELRAPERLIAHGLPVRVSIARNTSAITPTWRRESSSYGPKIVFFPTQSPRNLTETRPLRAS